jgi:hypothetical protein
LGSPRREAGKRGISDVTGYLTGMSTDPSTHDQDAEPPTPDGREPDPEQLEPDSEPASDPDPDPGASPNE